MPRATRIKWIDSSCDVHSSGSGRHRAALFVNDMLMIGSPFMVTNLAVKMSPIRVYPGIWSWIVDAGSPGAMRTPTHSKLGIDRSRTLNNALVASGGRYSFGSK